jgi:hypothetical protein
MATFYAKAFPQQAAGSGGGVTSLNSETGALTITAGTGIAVTEPTATSIQIASTSAGDVTLGAFGSTPNANGLSINGSQVLNMQPADATNPGGVSTTTQTIAGQKTFSSAILGADGTNSLPGYSFSSDPDSGIYRIGANDIAIAAGSFAGLEVKKSTGSFANVGMGSAPSASDNYPVLIQRDNASSGTYIQVSNPNSAASSKSSYQLATDLGANTGEVSVFSAAASADAYTGRMTVRPSDGTVGLSLIGGDTVGGNVRVYTGGDYASTGKALEIGSEKTVTLPQSIAAASVTTPSAGVTMFNDSGVFKTKNSSGTVASLSGANTGDITLAAVGSSPNANGASLSGQDLNLQPADGTNPGVVTTGTQTFAGAKTFSGDATLSGNITYTPTVNSSLSGANQRVPSHTTANIVFTNASLTSIGSANNGGVSGGHLLFITNATGSNFTIVNNYGSAAAGEAIFTGNGSDAIIPTKCTFALQYNATSSCWSFIGSGLTAVSSGSVTGVLPIANGGTNNASLGVTAGGIYYGDGSKLVETAAGTAGQYLASAGSSAPTWATQVVLNKEVFTSNGTFTIPSGTLSTTVFKFTLIGAGGGGGGGNASYGGGGGGGGGGLAIKWLSGLTAGNTITITRGGGGAGGGAATNGSSGGNTTIASGTETISTVTGVGGTGGEGSVAAQPTEGGIGGAGTSGDFNSDGQGGILGDRSSANAGFGGAGGSSHLGGGGAGGDANNSSDGDGKNGTNGGGGGGGGANPGVRNGTAGNGGNGLVIVEWVR